MHGRFIVIEGPDASGTTLHSRLLAERLAKEGVPVLLTAEPTDGPIGRYIRTILAGSERIPSSALQLLFTADRAWHLHSVVLPALKEGKTVISDRYALSTIAYGIALGLGEEWLKSMNKDFILPDVQILALPPIEVCRERLARREKRDILEQEDLQEKIHGAYRSLAKKDPSILMLDTSGEKETVAESLWKSTSH
jgi:dTMP kinase